MPSADWVVVVPLTRAERAESELQEALDLLGELLAMKEKGLGHDDLWRRCAVILRKHGRLTEGDSQ